MFGCNRHLVTSEELNKVFSKPLTRTNMYIMLKLNDVLHEKADNAGLISRPHFSKEAQMKKRRVHHVELSLQSTSQLNPIEVFVDSPFKCPPTISPTPENWYQLPLKFHGMRTYCLSFQNPWCIGNLIAIFLYDLSFKEWTFFHHL